MGAALHRVDGFQDLMRTPSCEIGDRYYAGEKLMLFTAALYSGQGRRLTIERRAVSLAR
jgi:hypothetical protein